MNSLKEERAIILNTKKNIFLFTHERYPYTLPVHTLENEYQKKRYQDALDHISAHWKRYGEISIKKIGALLNLNRFRLFHVHLTQYGTAGSFWLPNHIGINFSICKDPVLTIMHEVIHLIVEHFYEQTNKATHTEKEKIVECITELFNGKHEG